MEHLQLDRKERDLERARAGLMTQQAADQLSPGPQVHTDLEASTLSNTSPAPHRWWCDWQMNWCMYTAQRSSPALQKNNAWQLYYYHLYTMYFLLPWPFIHSHY